MTIEERERVERGKCEQYTPYVNAVRMIQDELDQTERVKLLIAMNDIGFMCKEIYQRWEQKSGKKAKR